MRRTRVRRAAWLAVIALVLVLALAPVALAAAGGGSAGFGGGGGGGGRGAGLYILFQILIRIAIFGHGLGALILIAAVLLVVVLRGGAPKVSSFFGARQSSGRAARHSTAKRERRVELAAAEAAEDDPEFAPDAVRAKAAQLFTDIQTAWDAGDRATLGRLVAPRLLSEWERRLDDFERRGWRNRVAPIGNLTIEYVGLRRPGQERGGTITVRIETKLRDYVEDRSGNRIKRAGSPTDSVRIREFWTLERVPTGWRLISIEQGAEGSHALQEQIVPTPWANEQAMRDEALVEGAVADAVPAGTKIVEIADLDFAGDARAAALDLSLADGRFAPDVLEVAARRAVAAWAEAVDGDDGQLHAIAHPDAVRELLYPGDPSGQTRLVVRGPRIEQISVTGIDPAAEPPTMDIDVRITGRRYLEDRSTTAVISGSRTHETSFTERWTLALDGDATQPWRIAAVRAAIARA